MRRPRDVLPAVRRFPQHSYSMSSLRKASNVHGGGGGGGAAPYSGSMSGPVQVNPPGSNFYLARGEIK